MHMRMDFKILRTLLRTTNEIHLEIRNLNVLYIFNYNMVRVGR